LAGAVARPHLAGVGAPTKKHSILQALKWKIYKWSLIIIYAEVEIEECAMTSKGYYNKGLEMDGLTEKWKWQY
jgi:hypothetical protein